MKANKDSRVDELRVDAAYYLFTEWLVRRGVFSAYKRNFERHNSFEGSFRNALHDWIRFVFHSADFVLGDLLDTSFPFAPTSEGFCFWARHSTDWNLFCVEFKHNL